MLASSSLGLRRGGEEADRPGAFPQGRRSEQRKWPGRASFEVGLSWAGQMETRWWQGGQWGSHSTRGQLGPAPTSRSGCRGPGLPSPVSVLSGFQGIVDTVAHGSGLGAAHLQMLAPEWTVRPPD